MPDRILTVVRAVQRRERAANGAALDTISRIWDQVAPINDADLSRFIDVAKPRLTAAAATIADDQATAARILIARHDPDLVRLDDTAAVEVLTRPVTTVRRVLADGRSPVDALSIGRSFLRRAVDTRLVVIRRDAASTAFRHPTVTGWRRVPDAVACPLCRTAATRRYTTDQLMAIHDRCGCAVAPIIGDRDPGPTRYGTPIPVRVSNDPRLGRVLAPAA